MSWAFTAFRLLAGIGLIVWTAPFVLFLAAVYLLIATLIGTVVLALIL